MRAMLRQPRLDAPSTLHYVMVRKLGRRVIIPERDGPLGLRDPPRQLGGGRGPRRVRPTAGPGAGCGAVVGLSGGGARSCKGSRVGTCLQKVTEAAAYPIIRLSWLFTASVGLAIRRQYHGK